MSVRITVENLSFSYGKQTVIRDLSMTAAQGECVVVCGRNGSGKSTLLSILAGIRRPACGTVCLKNGARIGYLPQGDALLMDATVGENLRFFADLTHCAIPENLPFAIRENMGKRVSLLSGGMRKQVSIACAMLGDPEILLLDEPCAALDLAFREELTAMAADWKRAGKTIVYVGHDPMEFYPFFDRLLFLSKNTPPQMLSRAALGSACADADAFCTFFARRLTADTENGGAALSTL